MMRRDRFLSVTAALTAVKQAYHGVGETRATIRVHRLLKGPGGRQFDSVALKIEGPPAVFVAIGGILWGIASALGCAVMADCHGDIAQWTLAANGEPELEGTHGEETEPRIA